MKLFAVHCVFSCFQETSISVIPARNVLMLLSCVKIIFKTEGLELIFQETYSLLQQQSREQIYSPTELVGSHQILTSSGSGIPNL